MPTENGVIWHPVKQAPDVTEKLLFENGLYKGQNGSSPSDDSSSCSDHKQTVHLEKKIGLFSGVGLIVGTMIGSGIFISPQGVLRATGSVGLSLIVWGATGIWCTLGALAYAELGTMINKSGAEYSYLLETFRPMHRNLGAIPAYIFSWVSVIIIRPSAFAIIALSFGTYAVTPFFEGCDPPDMAKKLAAIWCICTIAFVNCWSVQWATNLQNIFTVTKLLAVGVIIGGGVYNIATGEYGDLLSGFEGSSASPSMLALAFYDGLWAYDGWSSLNFVTEEMKNPYVNLPRSILIGLPLVTICYVLINVSYLTVIPKLQLLATQAVAVSWGDQMLGIASFIIPLSVAFSTFGSANGTCFTAGRLSYAAAREGHIMEFLSYVNVKRLTPSPSILFMSLMAILMIVMGNINSLIDCFSFLMLFFYAASMVCLLILRQTRPDLHRPYKVPLFIPWVVLIVSLYMVISPIVQNPQVEFLYAALFAVSGLVFYVPCVVYKFQPVLLKKFTKLMQLMMWVAPTSYED